MSVLVKVMFVCLGNICRSPTAHGLFAARVAEAGLSDQILVSSSGTGGWHVGSPPDPRSVRVAQRRGVDLSQLRASQVTREDFTRQDYILAMDKQNLRDLRSLAPPRYHGHLGLFLQFGEALECLEVPDPYYDGEAGFERVAELIDSASAGLLQHIREHKLGCH